MTFVEIFKQCYLQMWKCKDVKEEYARPCDTREFLLAWAWAAILAPTYIACILPGYYLQAYPFILVQLRRYKTLGHHWAWIFCPIMHIVYLFV